MVHIMPYFATLTLNSGGSMSTSVFRSILVPRPASPTLQPTQPSDRTGVFIVASDAAHRMAGDVLSASRAIPTKPPAQEFKDNPL